MSSDLPNPTTPGAQEPLPPMVLPARVARSDRGPRREPAPAANGFGRLMLVLLLFCSLALNLLLCVLFMFMSRSGFGDSDDGLAINEKHYSNSATAHDKVAVIHIEGMLIDEAMGYTKKQIEKAAKDSNVKAVVVRINSPGGTITASDDIHRLLTQLRDGTSPRLSSQSQQAKPLVVSMGPIAASGGYFIAMPAQYVFAERTTVTGSIGVYASFINVHKFAEEHGVHMELVKAGAVKGAGSMFKELRPEERQMWQDMVDNAYSQFLSVVEAGRPPLKGKLTQDITRVDAKGNKLPDEIPARDAGGNIIKDAKPIPYKRQLADGGIYTAQEAKHYGLVDEIGFLEDATKKAATLANLSDYEVVVYERPISWLSLLGGGMAQPQPDFAKLALAASPRIWYLAPQSEAAGILATVGKQ